MKRLIQLAHLDAAENVFFARELEFIAAEQFDVKKVLLKARQIVPVDNSIPDGDETHTYRQFDSLGKAKAISDYADDLPMVNVKGVEFHQRLQDYGDAFGYSIQELRVSSRLGRPLDRSRAEAARRVLDLQLDDIASVGDSVHDLKGFLGLSAVPIAAAAAKAGGGTTWAVATSDEILADMNAMVNQVVTTTKEVEKPSRILLPTAQYQQIQSKARSSVSDTTVLEFFLGTHPGMDVMSWERLTGAGAGAVDRAVAYTPDKKLVRLLMSVEFEQQAPQLNNFAYKINCRMRTGGVISPYPLSMLYMDGI